MTKEQKQTLQDCFEGFFPLYYALEVIEADRFTAIEAMQTWHRWEDEFEETGSYTF